MPRWRRAPSVTPGPGWADEAPAAILLVRVLAVNATTDPVGAQVQVVLGQNGTQTATYPDGSRATVVFGPDPRWGMQAPLAKSQTVTTPGGKAHTTTSQRTATLTDATDLLSLRTMSETTTINGRIFTTAYDAATRTLTQTSATGHRATTVVDARGRPVQAQLGDLAPTSYTYDARGRLATLTEGQGAGSRGPASPTAATASWPASPTRAVGSPHSPPTPTGG